jgi:uncharacterized membrane protein YoaK (UPF0700 family)
LTPRRDTLLILLALATGATDAAAFERLGHVFASVITGNLVVLGVGAVSGDHHLTLFAGCALAAYGAGVLLAAPRRQQPPPTRGWPPAATAALSAELIILIVFAVGWEVAGRHLTEGWQVVLIILGGAAMGVQSTAVRRLGQVSTTYLTSTLTGLLEDLRARRRSEGQTRSLGILAMALAGAAAATGLVLHAYRFLPVLQLAPVATVIVASRSLIAPSG